MSRRKKVLRIVAWPLVRARESSQTRRCAQSGRRGRTQRPTTTSSGANPLIFSPPTLLPFALISGASAYAQADLDLILYDSNFVETTRSESTTDDELVTFDNAGPSLARFCFQALNVDAISPGETWFFQYWHRDSSPAGPTSNFSGGQRIRFE